MTDSFATLMVILDLYLVYNRVLFFVFKALEPYLNLSERKKKLFCARIPEPNRKSLRIVDVTEKGMKPPRNHSWGSATEGKTLPAW